MRGAAGPGRWAGPPPLLVVATIAAFLVAPLLSHGEPSEPTHVAETVAATTSHETGGVSRGAPRPVMTVTKPDRPEPRPTTIGVVSFNQYQQLSPSQLAADARELTSRPTVDVIGWQEATFSRPVFGALRDRGWGTHQLRGHARELAISWRQSKLAYVSSSFRRLSRGVDDALGRYPFGNRYVERVTLRQRSTGRLISVITTHLPQKIEDLDHPGHWLETYNAASARYQLARMRHVWRAAPGRWVVGTGDYNFDARADARVHPQEGPRDTLEELVQTSYDALGFGGTVPTHPPTGRYIDYVQAARTDVRDGTLDFRRQRVIRGLSSDHNALLARIRLR